MDRYRVKKYLSELGITELNRIKEVRESLGLSVDDLAKACNVSVGEINMVENELRVPNQITIIKILRGFKRFGVHPHDVFTII